MITTKTTTKTTTKSTTRARYAPTPAKKDGRRPKMVYKSALFFERFPLRNFVQRIFFLRKRRVFFQKKE